MSASRTRNAIIGYITFSLSLGAATAAVQITSVEATAPPVIDGVASSSEWSDAGAATLTNGVLMVKHDATHLYVLIDMTADAVCEAVQSSAPLGDFMALAFDVDADGAITPNVDVEYGESAGTPAFGIAYLLGPSTSTGLQTTGAQLARGCGGSPNMASSHTLWELSLPLSEIGPPNTPTLRMGVWMYSTTPSISELVPPNFENDFSDLIEVSLGPDCNANSVLDSVDISTATSQDCDGNGVPDECDPDTDNDGVIDACDNCPHTANANQDDADGDGVGDACETSSANPMSCGCFGPTLAPFCFAYMLYVGHARRKRRSA